jgi:LacI family transcriptional regulator
MSQATRIAIAFQSWQQYAEAPIVGVARFAQQRGRLDLVDVQFKEDLDVPKAINRLRPDGVITQLNERMYNVIGKDFFRMLPLVNVGADLFARGVPSVSTDLPELVRMATTHLAESGYANFGAIASTPSSGYDELPQLMSAATGHPKAKILMHRMTWPGEDVAHDPGPDRPLQQWLKSLPKPIGIVTQYGYHGLWITQECERLKIDVPEQVGIISGLDENVCLFAKPAITSVRLAGQQLGYEAMRLLSELIRNPSAPPRLVTVKPESIVQRASTGPVTHEGEDISRALRFIQQYATQGIRVPDVQVALGGDGTFDHTNCQPLRFQ